MTLIGLLRHIFSILTPTTLLLVDFYLAIPLIRFDGCYLAFYSGGNMNTLADIGVGANFETCKKAMSDAQLKEIIDRWWKCA